MDERLTAYLDSIGVAGDALQGWDIEEATRAGRSVGFVMTRGPEIHILPLERNAMSRKNIQLAVAPLLLKYGYCSTRVPIDVTDHKLRLHLGFEFQWQDDRFTYWAMTELPYMRKPL